MTTIRPNLQALSAKPPIPTPPKSSETEGDTPVDNGADNSASGPASGAAQRQTELNLDKKLSALEALALKNAPALKEATGSSTVECKSIDRNLKDLIDQIRRNKGNKNKKYGVMDPRTGILTTFNVVAQQNGNSWVYKVSNGRSIYTITDNGGDNVEIHNDTPSWGLP